MTAFVKKYFWIFFASLFATYTVYEKFMLPELQIPMIVSIVFVALFIIFGKVECLIPKTALYARVAYALFAVFMVIGDSFKKYDSFFGIWGNPFKNTDLAEKLLESFSESLSFLNGTFGNLLMLISAVSKGIGYYFIIKCTFEFTKYCWRNICESKKDFAFTSKLFSGRIFLKLFLFIVVAWLPYLIAKFPAAVSKDAWGQINQFLEGNITTHHPYFTTLLYGVFAKIGLLLGNDTYIGIAIYIILQYAFMAASFARCILCAHRLTDNRIYSFIILLIFAFSPAMASYATTVVKDALYATLFALYITQMILVIYNSKHGLPIKKDLAYLSISAFFMCLTRNNGIYVVAATSFVIILYFLFKKNTEFKKRLLPICIVIIPLLLYSAYNTFQYDVMNVEKGSIKEALSIPFQQTARYVKEHPEDVTAEEAEIINRVLDYENLGELYDPIVSDPVKATYKEDGSALGDYFKVWFKHLLRHPDTYVEATINTNYFSVYPDEPNIRAYSIMKTNHPSPVLKALNFVVFVFAMGLSCVPIVSCVINPVFYVWIFIYLLLKALFRKKYLVVLVVMLPLLVQLLTVFAGPAVFNHPRYLYPVYWSIPFVVAYFISEKKENA